MIQIASGGDNPVLEENALKMPPESTGMPKCTVGPIRGARCACALLRTSKPGIVTAELAACLAGMLLATSSAPDVSRLYLVMLCVALAASGAAMANCLIEEAGDRLMPRLALRSQALDQVGGRVVRTVAALLMGTSLALAVIFINTLTMMLLGAALFLYLFVYTTLLKRTSPLSVLAGGIPGALPPVIGAAAAGSVTAAPLLLAVLIYAWQLPHFWFLALQCRDQYQQAGVPVFPLVYGENITRKLIVAGNVLIIPLSLIIPVFFTKSVFCSMLMLMIGIIHVFSSVWAVKNRSRYRLGFLFSLAYLAIMLSLLITDVVVQQQWHLFAGFIHGIHS
ncbi:MAG: protoheme IX farnesyltransferase [Geobacteraceae bacterium]|nr:protoheme IX farnesyltransferase [Geobacteraceae bacterium]